MRRAAKSFPTRTPRSKRASPNPWTPAAAGVHAVPPAHMTTARLDATTARLDASAVRARRAVATVFFLNGAVLASWIPHIPAVKAAHALGDGALGLVLLAMAAGAIVAMPIAGVLI